MPAKLTYIALLRAINVGGRNVSMAELKKLFVKLGFGGVETYIASGNVIFEASSGAPAALESKIEAALHTTLGYEVATFLRTPAQLQAAAEAAVFADSERAAAGAYNVAFLKAPLSPAQSKALQALTTDIDRFATQGSEVYWLCRVKQSESKFSNAVFERKVGVVATFRGHSTVSKMAEKYAIP